MAESYVKTLITDEATDEDSPGTETLFQDMGQSINYLFDVVLDGAGNSIPAAAGDYYQFTEWNEKQSTGQSYLKTHEIRAWRDGAYRVRFLMRGETSGNDGYGRIYVNGIAEGTERINGTGAYIEYAEDISGISQGDLIQIYVKNESISADDTLVKDLGLGLTVAALTGEAWLDI